MKMEDAKMVVNWTKIYAADPTQFIGKCECNLSISSYVKKLLKNSMIKLKQI